MRSTRPITPGSVTGSTTTPVIPTSCTILPCAGHSLLITLTSFSARPSVSSLHHDPATVSDSPLPRHWRRHADGHVVPLRCGHDVPQLPRFGRGSPPTQSGTDHMGRLLQDF